jgi:hypothetical protein
MFDQLLVLIFFFPSQVTANSVQLVSCTSRELMDQWNAPAGFSVNVASANASQVPFCFGLYPAFLGMFGQQASHI